MQSSENNCKDLKLKSELMGIRGEDIKQGVTSEYLEVASQLLVGLFVSDPTNEANVQ